MTSFSDYQNEIYFNGLRGVLPKLPVDMPTLEQKAMAAWPESITSYVQGGCGNERTQDHNVAAFQRWGLIPRMMVDTSKRDLVASERRRRPLCRDRAESSERERQAHKAENSAHVHVASLLSSFSSCSVAGWVLV